MALVDTAGADIGTAAEGKQHLSFSLADGEYAVEVLHVREIRGIGPITPLPNSPAHLKGVMNLRGAVVPVIDLRSAIGLPETEYGKYTVIIVLKVKTRTLGFLVDSVCDVISLLPGDIESSKGIGNGVDEALVSGIARVQERFIVLLDIAHVVGGGEWESAA